MILYKQTSLFVKRHGCTILRIEKWTWSESYRGIVILNRDPRKNWAAKGCRKEDISAPHPEER